VIGYNGWILLEARTEPKDRIAAMSEQLSVFHKLVANIYVFSQPDHK